MCYDISNVTLHNIYRVFIIRGFSDSNMRVWQSSFFKNIPVHSPNKVQQSLYNYAEGLTASKTTMCVWSKSIILLNYENNIFMTIIDKEL